MNENDEMPLIPDKKDIEWSELGKRGMHLNDALYFLNKIKECVKE